MNKLKRKKNVKSKSFNDRLFCRQHAIQIWKHKKIHRTENSLSGENRY